MTKPEPLHDKVKCADCQKFGRSFPLCSSTPGLQFDPDHDRLRNNP